MNRHRRNSSVTRHRLGPCPGCGIVVFNPFNAVATADRANRAAASLHAVVAPLTWLAILVCGVTFSSGKNANAEPPSSREHPVLARLLEKHPAADEDGDGTLSFAEYRAFSTKQGPRKQPSGRPAGPISTVLENGDLVIADFEQNNWGQLRQWGWKIEGDAFQRDLNTGTKIMRRRVGAMHGRYLVTSFLASDAHTGRIVSPQFTVELDYIELAMSGGDYPHRICVNLVVDNQVVRTATGNNDDLFSFTTFEVATWKGRPAHMEIIDDHRGVWGHINVDRIYQTERPRGDRIVRSSPVGSGQPRAIVQTRDGNRRQGPLSFRDGAIQLGEHSVPPAELQVAVVRHDPVTAGSSSAVRLVSGEKWQARITGFADNGVSIESPLFGKRQLPLTAIASLDFIDSGTAALPSTEGKPGTVYRVVGEPIAAKLVWIRDKDIAIDCALGVVPLPRASVQRFVLAAVQSRATVEPDEVGLSDGSVVRGRLAIAAGKLTLQHAALGLLTLEPAMIRYLRRTPPGTLWLDRMQPVDVQRVGAVLPPPMPHRVSSGDDALRTVRIVPRTIAHYHLPPGNRGRTFRGRLQLVVGCRVPMQVRIRADGQEVWQGRLTVKSAADDNQVHQFKAALGKATRLTVEVDFAGPVAFPCGVDWLDAGLLTESGSQPDGIP